MKNFEKMLQKRKGHKEMSDTEMEAKKSVIEHMRDMAAGMMGDNLKSLKKVTVASDSEEGLKKGLEKAEDIIDQKMDDEGEDEEEMEADSEEMSEEELNAKLEKLMALKEKMKAKKETY